MTKDPRKASRWTSREIEADGAGYIAAQKAEHEEWVDGPGSCGASAYG